MKKIFSYFTKAEILLWCVSTALITASFCVFDRDNYLVLVASLIGEASLILNAKGNPIGSLLSIAFAGLYSAVSYGMAYYGEMITYLGMTAPMALVSFISWIRNPYGGKRCEVKIARIKGRDAAVWGAVTAAVTVAAYFILRVCGTADLLVGTFSVATSFYAVVLMAKRSIYFTLAYTLNDVVLIILWSLAAARDIAYVSVIICFVTFFINDIYSFVSLKRIEKRQASGTDPT